MALRDDNNPPWRDPADISPLWKVLRHPFILLFALILAGAAAYQYLHKTMPLYTSTAVLRVQQPPPQVFGAVEPSRNTDETAIFLNAELAVLTSTPVLETALATPAVKETQTARALAATPDAAVSLRKKLRTNLGRKDDLISLELDSPAPAEAAVIVNAVVDAYIARQSHQHEDGRAKMLAVLEGQKADRDKAVKETTARMLKVLREAGAPALDSREKLAEISAMRVTVRAAQQEEATAQTQYNDAASPLQAKPELNAELEKLNTAGTTPTHTEAEYAQLRLNIADLDTKRRNLAIVQNLLPSHPQVIAVDQQLDRARLQYAASMHRHWDQVKARTAQLVATLHEQEIVAQDLAARAAEYAQAELDLKRLDEKLAVIDSRIAELKAGEGIGSLRVESIEQGRPAARPSKPDVPRTYALAAALGLLLGSVMAFARESSLARRRSRSSALAQRVPSRRTRAYSDEAVDEESLESATRDGPLRITSEELTAEKLTITRRGTGPWSSDSEPRGRRQVD
jgi:uncharacterized protein involved in exopolysaccharide biosynthesis